mgnify:CR=1 FL=1
MLAHCAKALSKRDTADSLESPLGVADGVSGCVVGWQGVNSVSIDVEVMHASVMAAVVDATRIGNGAEVKEETSRWVHHG